MMRRTAWVKLIACVLLVGGVTWLLSVSGFNVTRITPEKIRALILSFGMWAPLIYLLGYAQPIVVMPASVLTMAGGLVFGPVWGTLAALCGATLRACTQFGLARLLGREAVAKLLPRRAAALDTRLNASGFKTVLCIRLVPNVPFDVQNFGFGFSNVRFSSYLTASFLGLIPGSVALAYFGYALTDARQRVTFFVVLGFIVAAGLGRTAWSHHLLRRQQRLLDLRSREPLRG
jgi:uncharacterized membrane protein YdjX (TVP38/TMEM64 family)